MAGILYGIALSMQRAREGAASVEWFPGSKLPNTPDPGWVRDISW